MRALFFYKEKETDISQQSIYEKLKTEEKQKIRQVRITPKEIEIYFYDQPKETYKIEMIENSIIIYSAEELKKIYEF